MLLVKPIGYLFNLILWLIAKLWAQRPISVSFDHSRDSRYRQGRMRLDFPSGSYLEIERWKERLDFTWHALANPKVGRVYQYTIYIRHFYLEDVIKTLPKLFAGDYRRSWKCTDCYHTTPYQEEGEIPATQLCDHCRRKRDEREDLVREAKEQRRREEEKLAQGNGLA